MTAAVQRSFAGGELAPGLYARADMIKYATGLKTCRNFQVQKHGGVANRAGTYFTAEVKDSTKTGYFIDFEFNDDQTYMLEFGDQYMRIIRNNAQLLITGVAAWVVTTAYVVGDVRENGGTNYYCKLDHTSSAGDEPGVGGSWTTYWHAMTGSIYEIPTPYLEADLQELRYVQSGDLITIVHPSYPPRDLARTGHTAWTLVEISFMPSMTNPSDVAVAIGGAGADTYRYRVTAVSEDDYSESLAGFEALETITGATQANPVVITTAVNDYADDDEVYLDDIVGMTELNGRYFKINQLTTTTYELVGEDGTGHTAYSSGGTSGRTHSRVTSSAAPSTSNVLTVSWTAVTGALEYYVYREVNGVYGFIGIAQGTTFDDDGITPNAAENSPNFRNPFEGAGNYPSVVTYYQQRQIFANMTNDTERVQASRSADYKNFSIRSPLQANDAVTWKIVGKKVNAVRGLVELDRLLVLTSGGEHLIEGDVDGVIRPGAINPKQQGHSGSGTLAPITIGDTALYLQARGSVVRDLKYIKNKGYGGSDLTVFADHLFEGFTIVDWDFQQIPDSVVWAVRSDGALLGLTYLPEHEVWGWHRHDTDGYFENVRVVPEGNEDAVYFIVRRTINGVTKRYIERLHSRIVSDIRTDAFFVDSGLTYDGRNTDTGHTMTLSGGSTWEFTEDLTLTSSTSYFVSGDEGNTIVLKLVDVDGNITDRLTCTIITYTSGTVVTVNANKNVPTGFQTVALSDWGKGVDQLTNLGHLEAKTVSILNDGNVEEPQVVASAEITLTSPGVVIHVGLPIQSDFETLDLDTPEGEPLTNKKKLVKHLTMHVESSRGVWAGPDADNLLEYAQREFEDWGEPTALKTGKVEIAIESTWNDNGRIFVRQDDPLPLTILSVVPEGDISD